MSLKQTNKFKILNDPIYGFITIPNTLISNLIEHPYFQRLRRVAQMGMSYMVYPGAHHTRFHHAIGAMHLMLEAVRVLRSKGIEISEEEENAVSIAILLHDIGHGAFSHALEHSIVTGISHEEISIKFMEKLNIEFNGQLSLAIAIFKGNYHRRFLHQLISSQLDMDRLDYLKRDSFYTGVSEGNINSDRLITMLNVKDDNIVIEGKGVYSVEKFIVARRLMYWQVYLHKTSLVAEGILVKLLKRAKSLASSGVEVPASSALKHFLYNEINSSNFNDQVLELFSRLDDYDVLSAVKEWISHEDKILSLLSRNLIHRKLFKIKIQNKPFEKQFIEECKNKIKSDLKVDDIDLEYFFLEGYVSNQAYDNQNNQIQILFKDGRLMNVEEASDSLNIQSLSKPVVKYFVCYPKSSF